MCNIRSYLIPDYVYTDIEKSLVERKSKKTNETFLMLSSSRFNTFASNETKQWMSEHPNWSAKFLTVFVKWGKHEITYPRCIVCGKELTERQIIEGRQYCSNHCQTHSEIRKQHAQETCLQRYGVKNPAQNQQVLEKRKQTTLERYGVEHTTQLESTKEKARQTLRKNYGVDHPMHSKEIKDNLIKHFKDTYGVDNPFKLEVVKNKIKNTMKERYGVEYYPQIEGYGDRIKQISLDKYGVINASLLPENKEKRMNTMLERYGVTNSVYCKESMAKLKSHRRESEYDSFVTRLREKNNLEIITPYDEYIKALTPVRYRCLLCDTEFENDRANLARVHCPNCYGGTSSQKELELLQFIEELEGSNNVITNDRTIIKPYELDIVVSNKHLAVEFNGSYWHSERIRKNRTYHKMKTDRCNDKGYHLIHVFEYEWDNKKEKIKAIIKHALGHDDIRIYARQCQCKPIDSKTYRDFLEVNHLQGAVSSSTRLGLYYNDELVAVIGFGLSRFKVGEVELHRFCPKLGYNIIGGFSKLIKHSGIKHFYTYVDRAHFNGSGYLRLGFTPCGVSEPNYVYLKSDKVLSRMACQKHKLPALLGEGFDQTKSEYENMTLNGWNRLFDCGNLKLEYNAE